MVPRQSSTNLRWIPGSLVGLLLLLWPGEARSAQEPQVRVLLAGGRLAGCAVAGSRLTLRDGSGNVLERREEGLTLRAHAAALRVLPESRSGCGCCPISRMAASAAAAALPRRPAGAAQTGRLQAINRLGGRAISQRGGR